MSREDVVLQQPEDLRFQVPVFHTPTACCGAVTAYLLRRIAYRAGSYAPGIQEHMFHELNTSREGGTIEKVQRWFSSRGGDLHHLGYRLLCRRVALQTPAILDWVKVGKGYRGAMLPIDFNKLHARPNMSGNVKSDDSIAHAVGITVDRLEPKGPEDLVMIDPWPGVGVDERSKVHENIDLAHKAKGCHALLFFWVGWS